jgi:hypothetical protein
VSALMAVTDNTVVCIGTQSGHAIVECSIPTDGVLYILHFVLNITLPAPCASCMHRLAAEPVSTDVLLRNPEQPEKAEAPGLQ